MMEHIIGHKARHGRHSMKKILLIIAIAFLIFQMAVLSVEIDIGSPAINRTATYWVNKTKVHETNPANANGTITEIEIWCDTNHTGVEVGIFYLTGTSGDHHRYSTRDWEYIGDVAAGAKRTFAVDLDVIAGDFIGYYASTGNGEFSSDGGGGMQILTGDYIPCTDVWFTFGSYTAELSVGGTGESEAVPESSAIFMGTNF